MKDFLKTSVEYLDFRFMGKEPLLSSSQMATK